ncbi:omp43 precursor [Bartonella ancashensis]|uniref:Porin n=2 Tax=Bartonella ancashensis TaxID=1318743 RepID=A0A0M4LHB8_9HYPH|nr:omp43 precursor [Bartonella ancashensis]
MAGVSGAYATPEVVKEPKYVKYVRVCDAYGTGYFYIPGTETCMRLSGTVRTIVSGGDDIDATTDADLDDSKKTYSASSRLLLAFDTASETELGTLRSHARVSSEWSNGKEKNGGRLHAAYIELAGFSVGVESTIFETWVDGYGSVLNDDIISPAGNSRTNFVSYIFSGSSGFSAIIGAELGNASGPTTNSNKQYYYINSSDRVVEVANTSLPSKEVKDYTPNVLLGMKFAQGWGGVSTIAAYDAYYKKWAGKVRVDFNVDDRTSLWAMSGYKDNTDYYTADAENRLSRENTTIYANWGGNWAIWAGATYKVTPKAKLNAQVSYSAVKTFATSANVVYTLVPGLTITPEVSYMSWNDDRTFGRNENSVPVYTSSLNGKHAIQGMLRIQRSF